MTKAKIQPKPRCKVPGTTKVLPCNKIAVAKCTAEVNWPVCADHVMPAACNGFYPRYYGRPIALDPHTAAKMVAGELGEPQEESPTHEDVLP